MGKAKGSSKAKGSGTQLVAFRLEPEMLAKVDAFAREMEARVPGLAVTRTDAVRVLLTRALEREGGK